MEPETETVQDRHEPEGFDEAVLVEDVLVEEVSIDGMCGVY